MPSTRQDILLAAINAKWIHPSLALRLLKANLGPLEERCAIVEFALRQRPSEKLEAIFSARPVILGLSVSIWNHKATLELLKALKDEYELSRDENLCQPYKKPVVVLGGPEVSFLPENAEIFRYADHVIRGEAEIAFRELCKTILNKRNCVTNTASVSNATTVSNTVNAGNKHGPVFINMTETEIDLKKIKSAYRLYTEEDLSRKLVYVESSRGCPFGCEFCASSFSGQRVRDFPLEPFLSDMDTLIRAGAKIFKFLDRSFNLDTKRAARIMKFFLERIENSPSPVCVHFEMIPRNFPAELRELIRRFPPGSLRLEIGIQTLNPVCAELIKRAGDAEEALETVSFLAAETNAIIHADLIAGLPGEDLLSFGKGFDRLAAALKNKKGSNTKSEAEIQLGILKLLPGAPISRHSEEYGMRYEKEAPYEIIENFAMPQKEMDRIKNFARFWELIVNRGNYPFFTESFFLARESAGGSVFTTFMELSRELLKRFGRNWGIDRKEMENALREYNGLV